MHLSGTSSVRRLLGVAAAVAAVATVCGGGEEIEPVLYVGNPEREFAVGVYIGGDGIEQLRQLVTAAAQARPSVRPHADSEPRAVDIGPLDEADPDEQFFVVGGWYCLSGRPVLERADDALHLRFTDTETDCAEPDPVSAVFRLERADFDGTFSVIDERSGTTIEVEDWTVP